MSKDQPTQSDIHPEGALKAGRGFADEADAEGHAYKGGFKATETPDIQPDGSIRGKGGYAEDVKATDEPDAAGHAFKDGFRATEPAPDEPATGRPGDPDEAHFSDRSLKVHVVPIAW